jgi:hypothetical protein
MRDTPTVLTATRGTPTAGFTVHPPRRVDSLWRSP